VTFRQSANTSVPLAPVLTGVSSRFAKRIRRAGGTMKGQRTPGRCESSGNPAGEVRVRGSAELTDRGSNADQPPRNPLNALTSRRNFSRNLSTHSTPRPYSLPSPLRETWCAPGIREGRRCRIGRMTVCGWAMSPQVRALIGAFSVIAAPDEARPPDGRPQGRIIILNERPNGRPSSRPLNRGLLFDNGQGRKGSVAMNKCNRPPLGNGFRTFVSRFARK